MKLPSFTLLSLFVLLAGMTAGANAALEPVLEDDLGDVTGEGIAILPENIRIVFDPAAYIRTLPRGAPVNSAGGGFTDRAADLLWYGFAFSGQDGTVTAVSSANRIPSWGTASNPWVFRAISTNNLLYDGTSPGYPVLQYSAPRYTAAGDFTDNVNVMNLKYAFYGDIGVCNTGTPTYGSVAACGGLGVAAKLQSISVWDRLSFHGSKYSIFQSTADYGKYMGNAGTEFMPVVAGGAVADDDGSFGAVWLNRINSSTTGVMRFGVGGAVSNTTIPQVTPGTFNANEGIWVTDMDFNMPVGHLHYQPILFDNDAAGNMIIEVVRIRNLNTIYNYAYQNYGYTGIDPAAAGANHPAPNVAAKMCTNATLNCDDATHGQVNFGKIEFKDNAGTSILGSRGAAGTAASSRIDGIFVQHLKIKTLGL